MQISDQVALVARQLHTAAALGDERTNEIAASLAGTAEAAVRMAILDALSEATSELAQLLATGPAGPIGISLQLDGDEVRFAASTTAEPAEAPRVDDGDATARISLRLSESLKSEVERAAAAAETSVNTWLVRAAATALRPVDRPANRAGSQHRLSGWVTG